MLEQFSKDIDLEHLSLDSRVVRAPLCGRRVKKGPQVLGRCCGGFANKIHITINALGHPLRLILTCDERKDITQDPAQIVGIRFEKLIADKAFDSRKFVELVTTLAAVVIPPRVCSSKQRN